MLPMNMWLKKKSNPNLHQFTQIEISTPHPPFFPWVGSQLQESFLGTYIHLKSLESKGFV